MNPDLKHTLDSLLRLHFGGATDGEKNAALKQFKRKCAANNIDADEYFATSIANPNRKENFSYRDYSNTKSNKNRKSSQKSYKHEYSDTHYSWEDTVWNRTRDELIFEIKEPMVSVEVRNGNRVILINALCRKAQSQDRFGLQNFCIYSEGLDASQFKMDKEYIFHSNGKMYFRDHYSVSKVIDVESQRIIF